MTTPEARRIEVAARLRAIASEVRDERLSEQLTALADQLDDENDELARRFGDGRYLIRRGLAVLSSQAPKLYVVELGPPDADEEPPIA